MQSIILPPAQPLTFNLYQPLKIVMLSSILLPPAQPLTPRLDLSITAQVF